MHSGPALIHMFYVSLIAAPDFFSFFVLLFHCVLPGAVHSVISEGAGLEVTSPPMLLPSCTTFEVHGGQECGLCPHFHQLTLGVSPVAAQPLFDGLVKEVPVSC